MRAWTVTGEIIVVDTDSQVDQPTHNIKVTGEIIVVDTERNLEIVR